jgi:RNA polymerase sigma-70 factor (ECF subfamily)
LKTTRKYIIDKWIVQYYDIVLGMALRLTGNRDDAEDCAQDVFIRAWKKIDTFRGDSHPVAWLKTITYNTCYNHLNRNKSKVWNEMDETQHGTMPVPEYQKRGFDPSLLKILSPAERAVLIARVYDGLSFREVADSLNTTENSAKVSYHNAIKKLRKAMS